MLKREHHIKMLIGYHYLEEIQIGLMKAVYQKEEQNK